MYIYLCTAADLLYPAYEDLDGGRRSVRGRLDPVWTESGLGEVDGKGTRPVRMSRVCGRTGLVGLERKISAIEGLEVE